MKTGEAGLTFHWPDHRSVSLALPGFVALSLLAHAASFYLFQIAYPPIARAMPPPAQISLLAPGSPENDRLLRWIEAEDPALTARPAEVSPPHLFDRPYEPSFAQIHAQPKKIPETPPAFSFPTALPPLALMEMAAPHQNIAAAVSAPMPTTLRFSGLLTGRVVAKAAPLHFQTTATELQPACFLVGVSGHGEVRYLFLQSSSGDKAIDDRAATELRTAEFARAAEELTWGFATFSWGTEVFVHSAAASPAR